MVLLDDLNRLVEDVDTAALEGSKLAEAQAGEGGKEDHRAQSRPDGVGHLVDLLDGRHWTLGRSVGGGAPENARVPGDQLVLDGSGEDGVQEPIALGNGRGAGLVRSEQTSVPFSDHARTDLREVLVSERWLDVEPEIGLVLLLTAKAQRCSLLFEPLIGVLAERNASLLRGKPRSLFEVGSRCREERLGVSLGPVGGRSCPPYVVDPVPRLPSSGRQLSRAAP